MVTEAEQANTAGESATTAVSPDDLATLRAAASEGAGAAPSAAGAPTGPSRVVAAERMASPDFPEFGGTASPAIDPKRISMLHDVNLNVKIELGRTRMLIEDVLRLGEGSVVELDKLAGDPVDVFANERLIARGEVLVLNDSFCVRISEVFSADPHRVSE